MSFANKTAIITGATRGIGLNIAQAFAKHGARTILIGRDGDRVKHIEETFQSTYTQQDHQGIVLDVTDKDAIDQVFKQTLKGQQIDYLINAAGISRDSLLIQLKDQDLQDVINTNLLGTMRMSQHATKSMIRKRKGGCIINISSVIGIHGNVGQTAYSASKAGIIGFTKSLAKEVGSAKIRVNAIAPGFIETDMTSGIADKDKILKLIPLGKFGSVQDVSLAALFIAQSEYLHGQGESFNSNNPFRDDLIQDSPWTDQPTSPVINHSPYNPFADNTHGADTHQYSPSYLINSNTDLIDLQQTGDASRPMSLSSAAAAPLNTQAPNYTNLTDPSVVNAPHLANERVDIDLAKKKTPSPPPDIFEDSKIEEADIFSNNTSPPPPTTLPAAAAPSNDRTMMLASDGPGGSTSPYARANMQLPRSKKKRSIGRVIKDAIASVTGRKQTVSGIPGENGARIIHINDAQLNNQQNFLHNSVTTGKYSVLGFLPRFL
ncbi:hypothetical protein [Parasitella parasitica]|uniref:Ketoreductase domain-containing protein n=1 Tax=Parasitella parasitica TaxID=35722 RepID=A0A0B7NGN6_9FUNG|nr:hypothetical protein [Parasitella parasitica]